MEYSGVGSERRNAAGGKRAAEDGEGVAPPLKKRSRRDDEGAQTELPAAVGYGPASPVMLGVLLAGGASALGGDESAGGSDGLYLRLLSTSFQVAWKAFVCFEETEAWVQADARRQESLSAGRMHLASGADASVTAAASFDATEAPERDEAVDVAVFFSVMSSVAVALRDSRGAVTSLRLLTPTSDAVAIIDTRPEASPLEHLRCSFLSLLSDAAALRPEFFSSRPSGSVVLGSTYVASGRDAPSAGWWHHGVWSEAEAEAWREERRARKQRESIPEYEHGQEDDGDGGGDGRLLGGEALAPVCSLREAIRAEPHVRCLAAAYLSFFNGRGDVAAAAREATKEPPLCDWVLALSLRVTQAVLSRFMPSLTPSVEELTAQTLVMTGAEAAARLRGAQAHLFLTQEAGRAEAAGCAWRQDLAFEDRLPALLCREERKAGVSAGRARSRFRAVAGPGHRRGVAGGGSGCSSAAAAPTIGIRRTSAQEESIVVSELEVLEEASVGSTTSFGVAAAAAAAASETDLLTVEPQGGATPPASFFGPGDPLPREARSRVRTWRVVAVDMDRERVVAARWATEGGAVRALSATLFYARVTSPGAPPSVRRSRLGLAAPPADPTPAACLAACLDAADAASRARGTRWALFRLSVSDAARDPLIRSV